MALPRLTGAIRAFGNIADSELLEADVSGDIGRKRRVCADEESAQGLTWKHLSTTVLRLGEKDNQVVTKELRNLISTARDIGMCSSYLWIIRSKTVCYIEHGTLYLDQSEFL